MPPEPFADEPMLFATRGGPEGLFGAQVDEAVERVAQEWVVDRGVTRLLLLPPDHTRLHSYAGQLTAKLWSRLSGSVQIDVMPALGTHHGMKRDQLRMMFGHDLPLERFIEHNWRTDLERLGTVPGELLHELSGGRLEDPIDVAVNRRIVSGGYDLVLSIGQVVPHEVIGFANHSKNVCIGCGGGAMLHQSHYLGAVCGIERVLGKADTPVRRLMDHGFYEFVRPRADVRFLLTIVEDQPSRPQLLALTAGGGKDCFGWAADVSAEVNIKKVDQPFPRAVVYLDPREFSSTWLGNKAIYRTRKAMADDGELFVLAPAVETFGEDGEIDRLIRRYGYRGTDPTQEALARDPTLASNLSAAAHLIHGSTEGRFSVTYCTGAGLSAGDVNSVGYDHLPYEQAAKRFGITDQQPDGWAEDESGEPFYFIRNPALGLWST